MSVSGEVASGPSPGAGSRKKQQCQIGSKDARNISSKRDALKKSGLKGWNRY